MIKLIMESRSEFEEEVNALIKKGWKPKFNSFNIIDYTYIILMEKKKKKIK